MPVLGGEAATKPVSRSQVVEAAVALDRPRDLEGRGAQQPDILPDPPADRHHDLRREQAVVARPASRRIGDVVAEEVACPDGRRDSRKDVLENSAFIIDSASATIVPVPMELRYGFSCFTWPPKFAPVWTILPRSYPMPRR